METTPADIAALTEQIAARLLQSHQRLATAESCTGGWIGKSLTDLAGSSRWYEGGVIAYSNTLKQNLLGIPRESLESHGAVSEPVAKAMAEGVARLMKADHAVAVTGIAGPDGGTDEKPVGLVWIAWAGGGSATAGRAFRFEGDRDAVRRQTVHQALQGLIERLG